MACNRVSRPDGRGIRPPVKARSRTVESTDVIVYPRSSSRRWAGFRSLPVRAGGPVGFRVIRKGQASEEGPAGRGDADSQTPTPRTHAESVASNRSRRSHGTGHRCSRLALVILLLIAWPVLVAWWRGRLRRRLEDQQSRRTCDRRVDLRAGAATAPGAAAGGCGFAGRVPVIRQPSPNWPDSRVWAKPRCRPRAGVRRRARRAWVLAEDVVSSAVHRSSWAPGLRWWLVPSRNR